MTEIKGQLSAIFTGIDSGTPQNEALRGKFLRSFAYYTIKERLPVILTNVVDQLVRNKTELTECKDIAEDDMKTCIRNISKLKNEVQTNKKFIDLVSNADDVKLWNEYLSSQKKGSFPPSWFDSPWLYSECYMYRRLHEVFELSRMFKKYDYFGYQKKEALERSIPTLKLISNYFDKVIKKTKEKEKEYYVTMLKIALWSNRSDLSISKGKNLEFNQVNVDFIKAMDEFLIVDDSRKLFKLLMNSRPPGLVIDYVLDNAGLELFCDFCFCDFLTSFDYATKIRFHAKKFPWYVSDATRNDTKCLLGKMREIGLEELASRWGKYFSSSVWTIQDENFWTTPFSHVEMATRDPALYQSLTQSGLVIFKGDLNYRKLLRDINWKNIEKFEVVVGKFRPTNILAMRTVKSDLICGLTHEKIKELPTDPNWMTTGEYGMIQMYCKVE